MATSINGSPSRQSGAESEDEGRGVEVELHVEDLSEAKTGFVKLLSEVWVYSKVK